MSVINVTVTNAGAANVAVSGGSTVNAAVGNGGAVNVSLGTISPGNASIVSGTLTINSVTTLAAGSPAYVKNDAGTAFAAKLDIGIPAGPATLIGVGNTTTLASGSNATVTSNVTGSNLTLSFGIPAGANGINGVTPSFAIGNVVTGAAGSSASVVATTTNSGANVTLDLTIPRGDPGTDGSNGTVITLSDGTPANLGTPSAGNSNIAARADHIHQMPQYSSLLNIPANFPTNTSLVSGLSAGYSSIAHGHNYVTSFNNLTGSLTLAPGSSNVTLTANGSTLTIDSKAGLDSNAVIDGGNYVGEIYSGITITLQPTSVSATGQRVGNWTSHTTGLNGEIAAVAYAGSKFWSVRAASETGTYARMDYSSNNGATWTQGSQVALLDPFISLTADVIPNGGSSASNGTRTVLNVLSGSANDGQLDCQLLYTDDGSTWASTSAPAPLSSLAYGGGKYLALFYVQSGSHASAWTSPDAVNWTQRTLSEMAPWAGVAYGNSYFVVIGSGTKASISSDGVTWASYSLASGASEQNYDIAFGNGIFCVVGSTSGSYSPVARISTNGQSWTQSAMPVQCNKVVFLNGFFLGFNNSVSSTDVCISSDGVNWTTGAMPSSLRWNGAAYGAGTILAYPTQAGGAMATAQIAAGGTAQFSVTATSLGATLAYQWQMSPDAGATWSDISGATSSTLSLSVTSADNGKRYRCAVSATGSTTVYSQAAILTVT